MRCLLVSLSFHLAVFDLNLTRDTELWVEVSKVTSVHSEIQVQSRQVHRPWHHLRSTANEQQQISWLCSWLTLYWMFLHNLHFTQMYTEAKENQKSLEKSCISRWQHEKYFVSPGDFVKRLCFLRLSCNATNAASVGQIMPLSTSARYVKLG